MNTIPPAVEAIIIVTLKRKKRQESVIRLRGGPGVERLRLRGSPVVERLHKWCHYAIWYRPSI